MVLYPNKLPESERVCSGICRHNNILVGNIEKDYPHAEAIVMLLLIKL